MAISNQDLTAQLFQQALTERRQAAIKSAALSQEVQKNPNLKISQSSGKFANKLS